MTTDMWIALSILAIAILLFITEWVRVDIVAIGVMVALMLSGLLTPQETLAGFSNPAVLTIATLFIIGGAIMQTGLAGSLGRRILSIAGSDQVRLTLVIMSTVALLSAFMSDAGTVAVLLPAIISLAASARINPSKLLIPLAFGSLLGGATTLIGTPPNIIVSDLLRMEGFAPFEFFDYTPIGLILFMAGVLFMLFAGRHMLPDIHIRAEVQRVETPAELLEIYKLPEDLYRLRVRRNSSLVGESIGKSRLREDYDLTIIEVLRPKGLLSTSRVDESNPALDSDAYENITPEAELVFQSGDVLIVQSKTSDISHPAAVLNLGVLPAHMDDSYSLITEEAGVAEILLPPRSSLVGKTIVELSFGSHYQLTVMGIQRPASQDLLNIKTTKLRFGDTLLIQGPWNNILALKKYRRDFIVMGQPENMLGAPARSRAPLAMLILFGMLITMVTNLMPVVLATMLAAFLMILSGCITIDEAYESVDWKSIVLIAGMLPMSTALEQVGLVNLISEGLTESLGTLGPTAVLAGLFMLTSIFTQVLSNTATTVLIAPIGLASASQLAVEPYAFLMGIAVAASMAFATPVASPVNTLVMGAGSYRFSNYLKVGIPMILLVMIASLIFIPILWPF